MENLIRTLRTDVHRPSVINPADYDYVGEEVMKIEDMGDVAMVAWNRARIADHMKCTGGTYSRHAHGGNCHICGNVNAIYTVLFHHKPSNTYIRTGQDCAENLASDYDGTAFRNAVNDARKAKAGKAKAKAILDDMGLSGAWNVFEMPYAEIPQEKRNGYMDISFAYEVIRDMVGKLIAYGDLSDKQFAFMAKLVKDIENRPAIEAARQAESDAANPVPVTDKRIRITGEILSVKWKDTAYGTMLKMLVRSDDGFKVYGTVPAGLDVGEDSKGTRVAFDAKIQPSRDDPKFGFFNRPTKGEII